jgi:acyl-homoserine-lactone acylase
VSTDFMELRAQQTVRLLMEILAPTFDQVISQKFTNWVEMADRLLDSLVAAARAQGGAASEDVRGLAAWDRTLDADSRGALLFI